MGALVDLGFASRVPGNASRFFTTQSEARQQPTGFIELAWDPEDPFVRNMRYQADLIAYDDQYCTTTSDLIGGAPLPTVSYFEDAVLPLLPAGPRVIEIGCGQGEFVQFVRNLGLSVVGYDPVGRPQGEAVEYLQRNFWNPNEPAADLYVMRCVLPHIEYPWDFLDSISLSSPSSLVLVEFQRLEWVLTNRAWYQVSHDHVNIFQAEDFRARYDVVAEGVFSNGEWGWVLLRSNSRRHPTVAHPAPEIVRKIGELQPAKEAFLAAAQRRRSRMVTIWGAAGKGIVVAFGLWELGIETVAVDADSNRWGRHLEASGALVISPDQALSALQPESEAIWVCNPNHVKQVRRFMSESAWVAAI